MRIRFAEGVALHSAHMSHGYFDVEIYADEKLEVARKIRLVERPGEHGQPVRRDIPLCAQYYLSTITRDEKGALVAVLKHAELLKEIRLPEGKWVGTRTGSQDSPEEYSYGAVPQRGKVLLAPKDKKLVIVSLGSDDGVVEGMVLFVSRGDTKLGDVRVVVTYKNMSGAEIFTMPNGPEIKEGDDVTVEPLF